MTATVTTATAAIPARRSLTGWKRRLALAACGAPALMPLVFMAPSVATISGETVRGAGNDVFGSGGAMALFLMLLVTPLSLITGARWFNPALRQWFGIVFAVDIIVDGITAATDTSFAGGIAGRLAGHTFLAVGFTMVLASVPLLITANRRSLKALGRYWRPVQRRGTYVIWALLFLHLALLEGFGLNQDNGLGHDAFPFDLFHQRFYQVAAISGFLVAFRLPWVRDWVTRKRKAGEAWKVYVAAAPLLALFALGMTFLVNELVFKGIGAFTFSVVDD